MKIRMKPLKQHILLSVKRENNIMSVKFKNPGKSYLPWKNSLNKMTDLANEIVREITEEEQPKVIDIEERNGSLYEHTVLVTMLSLVVAKMLKVKEESYIDIAIGALLHDLGMRYITVPYINFDMDNRPASEVFELKNIQYWHIQRWKVRTGYRLFQKDGIIASRKKRRFRLSLKQKQKISSVIYCRYVMHLIV